jgi:hypothetical protein
MGDVVKKSVDQPGECRGLFTDRIAVINIGLECMVEPFITKGVPFVHVDWHPPASGKSSLLNKIMKLTKEG